MENITSINYIEAAFLLQQITDPELQELKALLTQVMIEELQEPECLTLEDRVAQITDASYSDDSLSRLNAFVKEQGIQPIFVENQTEYYEISKELDRAITIFFTK